MPTIYWHQLRRFRLLFVIAAFGLIATGAISCYYLWVLILDGWTLGLARMNSTPFRPSRYPIVVLTAILIPYAFARFLDHRLHRYVAKNGGVICFECGYNLRGLPSTYACPECGARFTAEELQLAWSRWFGDAEFTNERKKDVEGGRKGDITD